MADESYLIVNPDTGALDGWYPDQMDDRHILDGLRELRGRWALVRAVDVPENSGIGEEAWDRRLRKRTTTRSEDS